MKSLQAHRGVANRSQNAAADPTPDEIRIRCEEVRRNRRDEQRDQLRQRRERQVISAVNAAGSITSIIAARLTGQSQHQASILLAELSRTDVLVRVGGGGSTRFTLPDRDNASAFAVDLESARTILQRLRDRSEIEPTSSQPHHRRCLVSSPYQSTNQIYGNEIMITTTIHIDRTEAESTQLRSLDEMHRRRQELSKLRKLSMNEARRPTAPLAVQFAAATKPKTKITSTETLEQLDAIYNTAERLGELSPLDAIPIARALLSALLRLSYAKVQGKPNTNPEPNLVPVKLFNKGIVTKTVMRRMKAAIEKSTARRTCWNVAGCSWFGWRLIRLRWSTWTFRSTIDRCQLCRRVCCVDVRHPCDRPAGFLFV